MDFPDDRPGRSDASSPSRKCDQSHLTEEEIFAAWREESLLQREEPIGSLQPPKVEGLMMKPGNVDSTADDKKEAILNRLKSNEETRPFIITTAKESLVPSTLHRSLRGSPNCCTC